MYDIKVMYRDYTVGDHESDYVLNEGNGMVLYARRKATLRLNEEGWLYRIDETNRQLSTQVRRAIRMFMNDFDLGTYQLGLEIYNKDIRYNIYTGEMV